MNNNILIIPLLFLISIFIVNAQPIVIGSNFTGYGINYDGSGNLYITCGTNSCNTFGTDTAIVKYIVKSNNESAIYTGSRHDNLISGVLPHLRIIQTDLELWNNYYASYNYKNFGSTAYYVYTEEYLDNGYILWTRYYTYDFINNRYNLVSDNKISLTNGVIDNGDDTINTNIVDSRNVINNNNYFYIGLQGSKNSDIINRAYNNIILNKTSTNTINYMTTGYLYNVIHNTATTPFYTSKGKYNYKGSLIKVINSNQSHGLIDFNSNIILTSDVNNIYYSSLANYDTNGTLTNIKSLSESCSNLFTSSNEIIVADISCNNKVGDEKLNCAIVGRINNNSLIFGFDGTNCYYEDITSFNTTSVRLNALTNDDYDGFYITGENILLKYSTIVTQTLNPQCLSSSTYCTTPILYQNGQIGCDSMNNIEYCAEGCINNVCINTKINQCDIVGERKCLDSTTQLICEDNNADGYLEFTTTENCAIGTYCINSFHFASCKNISSTGVHDQYGLVVTPYSISDENTTYTLDNLAKSVKVLSVFDLHYQDFFQTGTQFFSRTCDYKETKLNSDIEQTEITSLNQFVFSSAIGNNFIARLSFSPKDYDNGSIEFKSQTATTFSKILYSHNLSDKRMCFYYADGSQIYCDYDYLTTDTLKNVNLEYVFDKTSNTYTIKMYFNRTNPVIKIVYPQVSSANDIASFEMNAINTSLNYVSFVNVPSYREFSSNNVFNQYATACAYLSTGSRTVRTYGNNDGTPDYSVYTDWIINIDTLGITQSQLADKTNNASFLNGSGLTTSAKYLIVLISIMTIICIFVGVGFATGSARAGFITGIILGTFAMIFFTVFDWIPVWIVVMLVIVSLALIILIGKTGSSNSTG
jgi:hypothetical protein